MPAWIVKPSFKKNFHMGIFQNQKLEDALYMDQNNLPKTSTETEPVQPVDSKFIEKLDNYSAERWEVCKL